MAQINIFLPDQGIALEQLLTNVKNKIHSLQKSEKSRRRRWLVKKAKAISKPTRIMLVRLFLTQNVMLTSK